MTLFKDTLNYDELMSVLVDLVINIACFYRNDGLHKLLECFEHVKDDGKIELVGRLMRNHYEELKAILCVSSDTIQQNIKDFL